MKREDEVKLKMNDDNHESRLTLLDEEGADD
jgi:hypothetical protein